MKPGPELNKRVATLMGQHRVGDCPLDDADCPGKYEPQIGRWPCLPPYSTDIAAAWEVVKELSLFRDRFIHRGYTTSGYWMQETAHGWKIYERDGDGVMESVVTGNTEAHAICLAALRLVTDT